MINENLTPHQHTSAVLNAVKALKHLDFVQKAWVDEQGISSNFGLCIETKQENPLLAWAKCKLHLDTNHFGQLKSELTDSLKAELPSERVLIRLVERGAGRYNLDVGFYGGVKFSGFDVYAAH